MIENPNNHPEAKRANNDHNDFRILTTNKTPNIIVEKTYIKANNIMIMNFNFFQYSIIENNFLSIQ